MARQTTDSQRNKQAHVIDAITQMAHQYGAGMKLPTAQQLATSLGVTLTTLDRSLTKLESRGIITRLQGSGIYVSSHLHNKRVGLVFGKNIFRLGSSQFYILLLQHCEREANERGDLFSVFLAPPAPHPHARAPVINQDLAEALKKERLDGLLLCDTEASDLPVWLQQQGIPAVSLGAAKNFPCATLDITSAIRPAVEALAKSGCKTIGLFGVYPNHEKPFTQAAQACGIAVATPCVLLPQTEEAPPFTEHEATGRAWMQASLERCGGKKGLPDGLLITDDGIARGACLYLQEKGIRPGRDIQIATHANKGSLELDRWADNIIQMQIDPAQIAKTMFRMLAEKLDGKAGSPRKRSIPAQILLPRS